jgi:hypothetical protein
MSKNKYKTETVTGTGIDGERKHRDHTKTGKLQRRRDNRRLEAIARQNHRIHTVENTLVSGKGTEEIKKYIASFKTTDMALQHAYNTLDKLRGGIPHSKLTVKNEAAPTAAPVTPEAAPAVTVEEKPKNKYRKKKAAIVAEAGTPQ